MQEIMQGPGQYIVITTIYPSSQHDLETKCSQPLGNLNELTKH